MKKHHKLKTFRVALALVVMLLITLSLSDLNFPVIKEISRIFLKLQFIPAVLRIVTSGAVFVFAIFILLLITIFFGRIYCSMICPLGILQDLILFLRRKIFRIKHFGYSKPLSVIRYGVLAILMVSILFGGIWLVNILDPYANYGRISISFFHIPVVFIQNHLSEFLFDRDVYWLQEKYLVDFDLLTFLFGAGIFILITVMVFIKERLYCNTICPVGTILGLLSKLSVFKIKIDRSTCTVCGNCGNICKSNCIDLKTLSIDESRCVSCYNCLSVCNTNSIAYTKGFKKKVDKPTTADKNKRKFIKTSVLSILSLYTLNLSAQKEKGLAPVSEGEENEKKYPPTGYSRRGTITPPGSRSKDAFTNRCVACQACVTNCPVKVMVPTYLEYGFTGMMMPKLDYSIGFCDFDCKRCGEVCPTGAILPFKNVEDKQKVQIGYVQFRQELCLVINDNEECGKCGKKCPTDAIKLVSHENGFEAPEVYPDVCVGCGLCEYICPVEEPHKAIFVSSLSKHCTL